MPTFYKITNTSRSIHTRAQRQRNSTHRGLLQYLGGELRLVKNRAFVISEDLVRKHLQEIRERSRLGLVELRTLDGRPVDLTSLEPVGAMAPTVPQPRPIQDSIRNDEPTGMPMPDIEGGLASEAKPELELPEPIGVTLDQMEETFGSVAEPSRHGKKKRH